MTMRVLLPLLVTCLTGPVVTSAISIKAAGASFPKALYHDAIAAYKFLQPDIDMSYTSTGSGKGKCRIMSHADQCDPADTIEPFDIDFAGSDSLLKRADYAAYPDLQMYPTLAGAVVPVYMLPNVTDLILSTTTLAKIFRGEITTWDDPRIKQVRTGLSYLSPQMLILRKPFSLLMMRVPQCDRAGPNGGTIVRNSAHA